MENRTTEVPTSPDSIQQQQADKGTASMAPAKTSKSDDPDSDSDGPPPATLFPVSKNRPKKPMLSLREQAEKVVLRQLTDAIDGRGAPAKYCCGGRILTVLSDHNTAAKNTTALTSPPIVIRWDTEDDSSRKLRLPIAEGNFNGKPLSVPAIHNLIRACNDSGTLSRSQFSTDFDPHYLGILDVVTQIMLPGFTSTFLKGRPEHRGVAAQLTHLQIHSGPSKGVRMFLPALPGNNYLGKLFVCLPNAHQGGQLEISNGSHSTIFDWGTAKPTDIQWAAFMGRCEHKMHPMEKGSQIILVYNLHVTERVGSVLQNPVLANASCLPLYEGVRKILELPGFMKQGGNLGFYCRYPYNHTAPNAAQRFPYALKGVDLVIYNVFISLGLEVNIRPLLDVSEELDSMDEMNYEIDADSYYDSPEEFFTDLSLENDDFCDCCGEVLPHFPSFKEWKLGKPHGDLIGYKFDPLQFCQSDEEASLFRERKEEHLQKTWKFKRYYNIKWLNEPRGRSKAGRWELALQNLSWIHGNEPTTEEFYSHVVLLVKVPKMAKRNLMPKE
ncbi:hypothetical protein V8E51_014585 [Hyaloscypha variabilis]